MAIEKIKSVSHQIEITAIANKTLLVCDDYLCLNIGQNVKTIIWEALTILGW